MNGRARGGRRWALLALTAGLAGAGCTADQAKPPGAPEIAAPVPETVDVVFSESEDGAAVTVPSTGRFAVVLKSWAEWRIQQTPDFVRPVETRTGPASPGDVAGADRWQVLVFETAGSGEGELQLALGRPWIEGDWLREYRLVVRSEEASAP